MRFMGTSLTSVLLVPFGYKYRFPFINISSQPRKSSPVSRFIHIKRAGNSGKHILIEPNRYMVHTPSGKHFLLKAEGKLKVHLVKNGGVEVGFISATQSIRKSPNVSLPTVYIWVELDISFGGPTPRSAISLIVTRI